MEKNGRIQDALQRWHTAGLKVGHVYREDFGEQMDGGSMYCEGTRWRRGRLWVENSRFQFWMCLVQDTCVIIKRIWAWSSEEWSGLEIKGIWTYRWYIKLWEWIRLSMDRGESQKERATTGSETALIFRVRGRRRQQGRLRRGQREGELGEGVHQKTGFWECSQSAR